MSGSEHPFAPFVRLLGKGKQGSRSLSVDEAREAMQMILAGEVRPEQLGAFLMLLRVKEESPEELCGFVQAVRAQMGVPSGLRADIDWSSYAGKKRQLPWYLLTALVLAGEGYRVLMHGARGHTPGRVYVEDLLAAFGLTAARSWAEVAQGLERGFAYAPLALLSPVLEQIIQLRPILGLRSPVHTLCRVLNPLDASYRVDGVFHPAYGPMHQRAAALLHHAHTVTLRGDGGEAEIKPDSDCTLQWTHGGDYADQLWPRRMERRLMKDEGMDPAVLRQLWRGEAEHPYGEGAVLETLAVMLMLLGQAGTVEDARRIAGQWWHRRDRGAY